MSDSGKFYGLTESRLKGIASAWGGGQCYHIQGEQERSPKDMSIAKVSLVRITRNGEKRKRKDFEVGAHLECSRNRNVSSVAGEM